MITQNLAEHEAPVTQGRRDEGRAQVTQRKLAQGAGTTRDVAAAHGPLLPPCSLHRRFSRGRVTSGPRPVLSKCESRGPATQNPAGVEPLTRVRSLGEVAVLRNYLAGVTLEGQSRIQRLPGGAARRPGRRAASQSSPAAPPPSAPSPDGQVPTPRSVPHGSPAGSSLPGRPEELTLPSSPHPGAGKQRRHLVGAPGLGAAGEPTSDVSWRGPRERPGQWPEGAPLGSWAPLGVS